MADDEDVTPQAGELTTANYGWVKPTVGASDDAWGGYLNTDLDGIDTTVKSVSNAIPAASSTTPIMSGAGYVGAGTTWARADHQHPSDTSRYATSNPSGYQTAAQVTAAVPVASSTTPVMDGIAAVGVGTTWARADHVHPTDAHALGDNRIINGDMRIDQHNNGALISPAVNATYTIDRWMFQGGQPGKFSGGRNAVGVTGPLGFPYYLGYQSLSAYTPLTGDTFLVSQAIEADMIGDLAWGTANAQIVTLSFWAYSGLTGTFSGAICNYANTRAYPFTFSLPSGSTWTKITVTIPGDTSGTWVMSGNAGSMLLRFDLGSGATFRGTANTWQAGNIVGATGAVNVVSTSGAVFFVTGVKLEIGSVATPYNRQSLAKSMADCQRYYSFGQIIAGGTMTATQIIYAPYSLPCTMRANPTIVITGNTSTNISSPSVNIVNSRDIYAQGTATATGGTTLNFGFTASAEL